MQAIPTLEVRSLSKSFAGNRVLDDISFDLLPGEVHALVGENGAGKSTLMNLLSGVLQPDGGEICIDGNLKTFSSPLQAQSSGIGTVFQELSLMPVLSVAENIFPNRAPVSRIGCIRWDALYTQARALLDAFGVAVDVKAPVASLPTSTRQVVEIAKALSLNARILLLDEPTSALTPEETSGLFKVIGQLKARGISIIYISHHLNEVFALADRITVLRDGHCIQTIARTQADQQSIVSLMVGREIKAKEKAASKKQSNVLLQTQQLGSKGLFQNVGLTLHAGEIIGLAGLMGSGRNELGQALAGVRPTDHGAIALDGKVARLRSILDAIGHGIAYLPAERKTEGLFLEQSVADNVIAATLQRFSKWGLVDRGRRDEVTRSHAQSLKIRYKGPHQVVGRLSGGNQQKVLLAKWLETKPRILIVDDPTRGIDVGAKAEIHSLLRALADAGAGLIVISSDLPELIEISDRIVVMHEGRISGELEADGATEAAIMRLAVGMMTEPIS